MGQAIPVRTDYSASEVRRFAKRAKDAAQARRLLAIAAVLDGASREDAAKIGGMDRQTLRDWVIRFNDQGPDGLINIPSPGAIVLQPYIERHFYAATVARTIEARGCLADYEQSAIALFERVLPSVVQVVRHSSNDLVSTSGDEETGVRTSTGFI